MFSAMDEIFRDSVKLGNNIRISLNNAVYSITDVYYVPKLKNNL